MSSVKVAVYVRVSGDDSYVDTSSSIDNQIKVINEYCLSNKFDIYKIYSDDGYSGKDMNRPAFKQLQRDLYLNKFNTIIVKDLSRIGRSLIKVGEFVEEICPKNGIRFISILDNYDSINYKNEESIVLKSFLNEYYLKECKKKARTILNRKIYKVPLFYHGCYGYDLVDGNLVINEEEANVIKRIFTEYVSGKRTVDICRDLEKDQVYSLAYIRAKKTKNRYDLSNPYRWDRRGLLSIIRNETYVGNHINGNDSKIYGRVKVENSNPAIISKDLWDKSVKIRNEHYKVKTVSKYAGLFKYRKTMETLVYRSGDGYLLAKGFLIKSSILEEVLLLEVKRIISEITKDDNHLLSIVDKRYSEAKKQLVYYENEVKKTEVKIKSNLEKYLSKKITSTEYKTNNEMLKQLLHDYKQYIIELQLQTSSGVNSKEYAEYIDKIKSVLDEDKDVIEVAKVLFKYVIIDKIDDKLVMEFEYNI